MAQPPQSPELNITECVRDYIKQNASTSTHQWLILQDICINLLVSTVQMYLAEVKLS